VRDEGRGGRAELRRGKMGVGAGTTGKRVRSGSSRSGRQSREKRRGGGGLGESNGRNRKEV